MPVVFLVAQIWLPWVEGLNDSLSGVLFRHGVVVSQRLHAMSSWRHLMNRSLDCSPFIKWVHGLIVVRQIVIRFSRRVFWRRWDPSQDVFLVHLLTDWTVVTCYQHGEHMFPWPWIFSITSCWNAFEWTIPVKLSFVKLCIVTDFPACCPRLPVDTFFLIQVTLMLKLHSRW